MSFNSKNKGFTLTETIIVIGIACIIFIAVFNFGQSIFSFNLFAQNTLNAQNDARRVLKVMVAELRKASPSSLGAYPIASAEDNSVIFFSNIDDDNYKERVRYFLDGTTLKKGIIKPSGIPLSYHFDSEETYTLIKNIDNGAVPVFDYFDSSYTGTSTPLIQPVATTQVRLIRITLNLNKNPDRQDPLIVRSQVFLRNLKDNL
ncbi:MAG: prepilin-type N-terminal cleavage/methylation domain-containing protein [Candidatus Zambryskibacteria bacterium]|nr:prepilin-type N-terminal cleavage/methylation domain-containing protein [Candidatus Zambryskibacteria bacterium]